MVGACSPSTALPCCFSLVRPCSLNCPGRTLATASSLHSHGSSCQTSQLLNGVHIQNIAAGRSQLLKMLAVANKHLLASAACVSRAPYQREQHRLASLRRSLSILTSLLSSVLADLHLSAATSSRKAGTGTTMGTTFRYTHSSVMQNVTLIHCWSALEACPNTESALSGTRPRIGLHTIIDFSLTKKLQAVEHDATSFKCFPSIRSAKVELCDGEPSPALTMCEARFRRAASTGHATASPRAGPCFPTENSFECGDQLVHGFVVTANARRGRQGQLVVGNCRACSDFLRNSPRPARGRFLLGPYFTSTVANFG